MRPLAFLALLLTGGCNAGNVPLFDLRYEGPHDERDVGRLVALWAVELEHRTGERAEIDRTAVQETALVLDGYVSHSGVVRVDPAEHLTDTALLHELNHVHLARFYGDPDRDHADGVGRWKDGHDEAIRKANAAGRLLGL